MSDDPLQSAKWRSGVQRIARMSVDELRVRALQALRVRLERLSEHFPRRSAPQTALLSGHSACRGGSAPRVRAGEDPVTIASALASVDPDMVHTFARQSEQAAQGCLSLLGYERLRVGNPPRWHREALSGIEAPREHWSRIDHLNTEVVGDHKLLWELNRHQYLLAPAFLWLLKRDARHFELVQAHLRSWLDDNPPRRGVNWVSSLEVSYRAITWCWLLWMLRGAPWNAELTMRLRVSLHAHARHIERFLSTYYSPNTHLTGEALGLFYLGTLLADCAHARRWRARGRAILEAQATRQVHPDGVYFEQASQYHRYTVEIYLHYLLLAEATGSSVSPQVRQTLGKLLDVMKTLASGAGHIPLIGDDDGGMLLPFDHRSPDDVRALLLAGAVALERRDLAPPNASPSFAYWLCGVEKTERMRMAPAEVPGWLDMYFGSGGLAVLRDGWDCSSAVAVIDSGPHGALSSAHSHADALAMTVSLGEVELFIDRGTLTYCGPERNDFRSTSAHNTLEIDGISSVAPAQPFRWLAGIPPRAAGLVCSSSGFSSFLGLAAGHVASGRPSAHSRAVLHQRGGAWVIHDHAVRPSARGGMLRWQLAADLTAVALDDSSLCIHDRAGNLVAAVLMCGAAPVRIVPREISPRLGERVSAQCLELPLDSSLTALTIVVPAARGQADIRFDIDRRHPQRGVQWEDITGRHRVIAGPAEDAAFPAEAPATDAGVRWRIAGAGRGGGAEEGALLAALPARAPLVRADVQAITHLPEESGRMIVMSCTNGRWQQLGVDTPRRG